MSTTTVAHFSTSSVTLPKQVYLDTSFVLRSYYAHHIPKGTPPSEVAKNAHCNTFLAKLHASKMHTSFLTVEEAFHTVYFKNHIRREARKKGLDWKQFRVKFPIEFGNARALGLQELKRFVAFVEKIPIKYVEATSFFQSHTRLKLLRKYARLVLEKYDTLEPMDTFHIAIMRLNRIEWFVTAEENIGSGYDEFSVLTL